MPLRRLLGALPLPWCATWRARQTRAHNCVQTVLALALDLPISTIEEVAGTPGPMWVSDVIRLLERLGVHVLPRSASLVADLWPETRDRHGGRSMRACGFRVPRTPTDVGHAYLLRGSTLYDPQTGNRVRLTRATIRSRLDIVTILPVELDATVLTQRLPRRSHRPLAGAHRLSRTAGVSEHRAVSPQGSECTR